MDITPKLNAMDNRLERIEDKLDSHLDRVSRAERDIEWIRGHLKISTGIFLSVVGVVCGAVFKYLLNK